MTERDSATFIITLPSADDFDEIRGRISRIKGIRSVEFNYGSRKMRVKYHGDEAGNNKIQREIAEIVAPRTKTRVGRAGEKGSARQRTT